MCLTRLGIIGMTTSFVLGSAALSLAQPTVHAGPLATMVPDVLVTTVVLARGTRRRPPGHRRLSRRLTTRTSTCSTIGR